MVSSAKRRALVIGGGIGGLSAALALRQAGMDVQVFEAVKEVKEVGAGVTVWSNAVRALERLGLLEELRAVGMPATDRIIYTWRGEKLSHIKVEQLAGGLGAVIQVVHRADLQNILLCALGTEHVRLNARCTGFTQDENCVRVRFEDGYEAEGDVLIAADGVRSALRKQLFGDRPLRYAGYTTWRGIAPLEDEKIPVGVSSETWGTGTRIGLIPLNDGRMYWFAGMNAPEQVHKDESAEQRKHLMQSIFRGWHSPVEAVIEATPASTIINADIYELNSLPHWRQGRVILLGDAAHAMTPNMGQGACQAIEDGVTLGVCMQEEHDVVMALRLFEAKRMRRVQRVTTQSRRIGWLSQLGQPLACEIRNSLVKRFYTSLLTKELDWLLSYTV
jgi:2-polyprenyl-6-methoxyphenol hydroxylase-like FAD-dependent oxidoreductase